jgi:hypothetical protein
MLDSGFPDVSAAVNGRVDKGDFQKQNEEHEFRFTIIALGRTCQASGLRTKGKPCV